MQCLLSFPFTLFGVIVTIYFNHFSFIISRFKHRDRWKLLQHSHTSKGVLTPSTNSSNISSSHWKNCSFDLSILIIYKNNIISVLLTQMSKNKLPTNKRPHYTQTGSPSRRTWIVLNHWFFNFECRVNLNTCRICVDIKIADSETLIMWNCNSFLIRTL